MLPCLAALPVIIKLNNNFFAQTLITKPGDNKKLLSKPVYVNEVPDKW